MNRIFNLTDIPAQRIGEPFSPADPRPRRWLRTLRHAGLACLALVALSAAGAAGAEAAPAAVAAKIKSNTLTVTGTSGPDAITLRLQAGAPNTLVVDVGADGTPDFQFDRSKFAAIVVDGGAGADVLVADPTNGSFTGSEATTFNGGSDSDRLVGEAGPERLNGGAGSDTVDGSMGVDTISGGDGDDTIVWEPGDGSDVIVGGAGSDRLVVHGNGGSENLGVGPAGGGHVRVTRDIGTVVLDVDDAEILEFRVATGTDNVSVSDLTGTDVAEVRVDFGADDGVLDSVIVPPGVTIGMDGITGLGAKVVVLNGTLTTDRIQVTGPNASDVVTVAGTSGADTIAVLANGTDVAVQGASPNVLVNLTTVELLKVNLGAGDDGFSAVGNLAALISLEVDGGDGADTLMGGNGADVLKGGPGDDFVDGNQGTDTLLPGDGNDVLQWDPGDGSDVMAGGAGSDRLVFNGSAGAENYALSAVAGGHVQFTRNLGAIVLDLDDIEVVEVRTFASTDNVSVSDLTGTDVTEVRVDFGTDDAALDNVIVPPGVTIGMDGITGLGAKVLVLNGAVTDRIQVTGPGTSDVVTVAGTSGPDTISVIANGTDVAVQGASPNVLVNLTTVELLKVNLGAGDDRFSAVGNLAALVSLDVDGGDGADTLTGGNGADRLAGGPGDDFVDGNQGTDTLSLGDGNDVVQWDPGDGNDIVTGGTGADRLLFNGSAGAEIFTISSPSPAAAGHVQFTRNLGNINLDLDDVEVIDLRAFGGIDAVTIDSLVGTDVTEVRTDLAAPGGADDAAADTVTVNGTAGDDTVTVTADGTTAVVSGLASTVRVSGAGPTTDTLTVNGLAGNDSVTGTPEAGALIVLNLVP